MSRTARVLSVVIAVVASLLLTTGPAAAGPNGSASPPPSPSHGRPATVVTLITGDRVLLPPGQIGANGHLQVLPADRPEGVRVSFRTWKSGTHHYVVPSDVASLVPSMLDPALFDVTALARSGLSDGHTQSLPLLIQHRPDTTPAVLSGPLDPSRHLDSIEATAATLDKDETARFGAALAEAQRTLVTSTADRTAGGPLAGVDRILLDAPFRATRLDTNLTQIGVRKAWRHGLSGHGVRVAVLDTGVDASHPDLAGQVVLAKNFSSSTTTEDRVGHGTHVASIVAGTGAAADRDRRGVAYGATLLSGKVLNDRGSGTASQVIAGMEWAVEQGADVVNLSVGTSAPSDGTDPVSVAVNELSASSDTLFVVSAGNTGPAPRTVGSPGAADAALTVGAVDSDGELASFSSRGPRLGDRAIKPEVTAPGVAITAARASGTAMGIPVDDTYVRASGTSMAAPHVAGAAALLAEVHPEWDGEALKAALVATARPTSDQPVQHRGAGLIDLDRALDQTVRTDVATVDFGSDAAAGGEPVARTVTVHNPGRRHTTVRLGLELTDEHGAPADDVVSISPTRLRLGPGESATATVTLRAQQPGQYAGHLEVNPRRGPELRLPLGGYVRTETATVHLRAFDRDGNPDRFGRVTLTNVDDIYRSPGPNAFAPGLISLDEHGEATVEAPVGTYSLFGLVDTRDEQGFTKSFALAGTAQTRIDGDTTLVVDARRANVAAVEVEGVTERVVEEMVIGFSRTDRLGHDGFVELSTGDWLAGFNPIYVQPTAPVTVGAMEARILWRVAGTDADSAAEVTVPRVSDRFAEDPALHVSAAELRRYAQVETTYGALGDEPQEYRVSHGFSTPRRTGGVMRATLADFPLVRTEYFLPDPRLRWTQCVLITRNGPPLDQRCDLRTDTRHPAGERSTKQWLTGPLDAGLVARRDGDVLAYEISPLVAAADRIQNVFFIGVRQQSASVSRDGLLLKDGPPPPAIALPDHRPSRVRIERGLELDPAVLPLPASIHAEWTFLTLPRGHSSVPPVLLADVRAGTDEYNMATPGESLRIEVDAYHLQGAWRLPVFHTRAWVSADDGATWHRLALSRRGGTPHGEVPADLVRAGGTLSIRVFAQDVLGNRVEQTTIGAIRVHG